MRGEWQTFLLIFLNGGNKNCTFPQASPFKTFHCLRYILIEVLKLQDLNQPVKRRSLL